MHNSRCRYFEVVLVELADIVHLTVAIDQSFDGIS
jgi:hypothetical protein